MEVAESDPHSRWTINDCVTMLILALIAFANLFPVSIIMKRHVRSKGGLRPAMRHMKFYVILCLLLMNLIVFIEYFFDMGALPVLNLQLYFLMRLMIFVNTFLIIYFTFRKASKHLANKQDYLFIVKVSFIVGMVVNFGLLIYMNIRMFQSNDHYRSGDGEGQTEKRVNYINLYFSLCDNPFFLIDAFVELL